MKFLIIPANNNLYKEVATTTNPSLIDYCDIYGLDHKIYTDNFDTGRPAARSKIKFILENFCNYDYIMWIDCDAKITNFSFNVLDFLDENGEIFISKDNNGINSGVFIVKCSEYMANFLNHTYNQVQYINNCWWEQAAINELFRINYNEIYSKVKYLPQNIFNSYIDNWSGESFILHCPAMQLNKRIETLSSKNTEPLKYEKWIKFCSYTRNLFDLLLKRMKIKTNWVFLKRDIKKLLTESKSSIR